MIKPTPTAKFKQWKKNFEASDKLPSITTSAVIELKELEKFIQEIKPIADSVNIHLMRFTWNNDEPQGKKKRSNGKVFRGCEWNVVANGKTQVALAISPAKYSMNRDLVASGADVVTNRQILLLIPGGEKEGPTGHNPPPKQKAGSN